MVKHGWQTNFTWWAKIRQARNIYRKPGYFTTCALVIWLSKMVPLSITLPCIPIENDNGTVRWFSTEKSVPVIGLKHDHLWDLLYSLTRDASSFMDSNIPSPVVAHDPNILHFLPWMLESCKASIICDGDMASEKYKQTKITFQKFEIVEHA